MTTKRNDGIRCIYFGDANVKSHEGFAWLLPIGWLFKSHAGDTIRTTADDLSFIL